MRRSGFAGLALALAACADAPAQAPRAALPFQTCINLGNALEAPREGDWGYRIADDHLRIIAEVGFEAVRLPVAWDKHASQTRPYQIDPAIYARVDQVIAQARAQGLAVVLDVHHYWDLMADPDGHRARFLGLWAQIAAHYAGAPDDLIFELLNEPHDQLTADRLNPLLAEALARVRRLHPDRLVILGGDVYSNVGALERLELPDDPNVVATFHFYRPRAFTHQGADFGEDWPPLGVSWGTAEERRALEADMERARHFAETTGAAVFLGEFGVFEAATDAVRNPWLEAVRAAAEDRGFAWCAWDFAGGFDLYDLDAGAWRPGALEALGLSPQRLR